MVVLSVARENVSAVGPVICAELMSFTLTVVLVLAAPAKLWNGTATVRSTAASGTANVVLPAVENAFPLMLVLCCTVVPSLNVTASQLMSTVAVVVVVLAARAKVSPVEVKGELYPDVKLPRVR